MTCQMTLVSNMIAIGLHHSVTWSSYLKVLATHQASIDIDGAKGHNAALLEIEVKVLQQQLPDQTPVGQHQCCMQECMAPGVL